MFFEINNTIQDSEKLKRKRILTKKLINKKFYENTPTLEKLNNELYYEEHTFQLIKIKIINIEDHIKNNFSF